MGKKVEVPDRLCRHVEVVNRSRSWWKWLLGWEGFVCTSCGMKWDED